MSHPLAPRAQLHGRTRNNSAGVRRPNVAVNILNQGSPEFDEKGIDERRRAFGRIEANRCVYAA
jgi:hypothetical protein